MEPGKSLLPLQELSTCPCLEPDKSSPCPHPTSWRSILTLGLRSKNLPNLTELGTFCTHIFKIIFSKFLFFQISINRLNWSQNFIFIKIFHYSCSYIRVKYIKCLRKGRYSLELKYKWNLYLVWFFLAIVARYLTCLDRTVLARPF